MRLAETEKAHETALEELERVSRIRQDIEEQKAAMLEELSTLGPITNALQANVRFFASVKNQANQELTGHGHV